MTYFWSDTHFNHAGIIRYCTRPYASVQQMNGALIERWNYAVQKDSDTVWLLGDFAFTHPSGMDIAEIFSRLRGRKCLLVGNHDERNPAVMKLPWERVERLFTFKEAGGRAELCHYPLETWKAAHHGALMLHGHSHGTLKRQIPHRFDMGADVRMAPVSWERIMAEAATQTFEPADHHGDL